MLNRGKVTTSERKKRKELVEDLLTKGYTPVNVRGTTKVSALAEAGRELGISYEGMYRWLGRERTQKKLGNTAFIPDWRKYKPVETSLVEQPPELPDTSQVARFLRNHPSTVEELSIKFKITVDETYNILSELENTHHILHKAGDVFSIHKTPEPAYVQGPIFEYVSRKDNTFLFGALGDTHLGSKYERLDVLRDLYDRFEKVGVDRVFHTGNWIDGEHHFNKHDLHTHGFDAQCRYLVNEYPSKKRIITYAIAGDDHEGWTAQREGINVGAYLENKMREAGRADWIDLGYMEAHVKLVNVNTGFFTMLAVVHPGGGSAYAESYSIQKIVESLESGEKPGVALYGHYHKLIAGEYRNVFWLQTGCTKGQDTFGRKKRLRYTLGGTTVRLEQDPDTGAIVSFSPTMHRYFDKGYYWQRNQRWSHSGEVVLPEVDSNPKH